MIALTLAHALTAMKVMDAPMLVSFDHESKRLEVVVMGAWGSVDNAKKSLDEFPQKGAPVITDVVAAENGVKMDEALVKLICANRMDGLEEVLLRENGQYIVNQGNGGWLGAGAGTGRRARARSRRASASSS